ncbi:MAG: phosphoesterase [Candidatus Thorarchaeota archaeon]|nr:MAG: phosphoesterase [Candidatus Thorarchaeota archaeon]
MAIKIFHACDPHGSTKTWEKMCRAPEVFKVDVAMMCGDLTGKAIMPIVQEKENRWYAQPYGRKKTFKKKKDLDRFIEFTETEGFYPVILTPDELAELREDKKKVQALFDKLMIERLQKWLDMAVEKVPKETVIVVNPGNDDSWAIDDVIKNHERVIYPLKRVVEVTPHHKMISMEWVNSTPWNTHRECSEEELKEKLEEEFARVTENDYENLLCNFHAPPYGSTLDVAPQLKDHKIQYAGGFSLSEPVGSHAVREVIEKYQPLVGMHGHIHESVGFTYIGRTLCVNPGSEYREGILKGFIITLEDGKATAGRVEL